MESSSARRCVVMESSDWVSRGVTDMIAIPKACSDAQTEMFFGCFSSEKGKEKRCPEGVGLENLQ